MKYFLALIICIQLGSCQKNSKSSAKIVTSDAKVTHLNEMKIYVLKAKTSNADFDYEKLENIDNAFRSLNFKNRSLVFNPVKGKFVYYQFVATFEGETYVAPNETGNKTKVFHDILIIKTDQTQNILDAFQYTLEWAEVPLEYDLFRSSAKGLKLENGLSISDLKLRRFISGYDDLLKDFGVIELK